MTALVFWLCAGLITYHHVGYPALLRLLTAFGGGARPRHQSDPAFRPSVTVIVPAHNEAAVIEDKIRNLLALDYPKPLLKIVIALDGCVDRTREFAEAALPAHASHVTIHEFQPNIGKVAVLNHEIGLAASDVVAVTDASALVNADALLRGGAHFADPRVGVVTGRYSVKELADSGESAYWRYQSDLKSAESRLAGPIGAHGAFYLFRHRATRRLPPDTINDDFVLPMSIVLQDYRAVFDPEIVARELERSRPGQEFRRRIRIGAGNLQQTLRLIRLGDPRRGMLAFAFLSGKALRGLLPFLFLAMIVASLLEAARGRTFFQFTVAGEALAVALALAGGRIPGFRAGRATGPVLYLLEGYLALGIGAALIVLRREKEAWKLSKQPETGTRRKAHAREGN